MGFFANDRLKKGRAAVTAEDKEALPKNALTLDIKPQYTAGNGTTIEIPLAPAQKSYTMDSNQKKASKQLPR